ncbi:protein NEOXANTHIN-DEFICIENT 1 [Momordica charantia]|uniref:Protein NEOXANTHIN-DEFICIENT 1 n=1 Tax=Momordica charantia TaxID=3673 RepID=A0A6J1CWZ7_MOMCH|nr:protein NEOXANTHIN-DEFICIENT 1 [Momordica charantia]
MEEAFNLTFCTPILSFIFFLIALRNSSSEIAGLFLLQNPGRIITKGNTLSRSRASMEVGERNCSPGYGRPPWTFRGRALYQLHLVKGKIARACIPKELRLVEAFGYTLGGFFLASYDDSPAGTFDELVVIAGIVWNRPTSCAWAAKVLVNSVQACDHGRKEIGLPSQVARFTKRIEAVPKHRSESGLLNSLGGKINVYNQKNQEHVQVTEVKGPTSTSICNINLSTSVPLNKWMGPAIKMSLPSYSGHTEYTPELFKYSCQIRCRVRAVKPMKVSVEFPAQNEHHSCTRRGGEGAEEEQSLSTSVLLSKPILALEFSCMEMKVEAPTVVSQYFNHSLRTP